MELLYRAFSGLSTDKATSLTSSTTNYDYNDIQTWFSSIFSLLNKADMTNDELFMVISHFKASIAFSQFSDKCLCDLLASFTKIFDRRDLTHDHRITTIDFCCHLLETRPADVLETKFKNMASLENIAIWALKNLATDLVDDKVVVTYFVAIYSMLGQQEVHIIQQHAKKEAKGTFLKIFEDELESKVDMRLRNNYLLIFFNIWLNKRTSHAATIASKIFDIEKNIFLVLRICADTISRNNSGSDGIQSVSLLVCRVVDHCSQSFLLYEQNNTSFKVVLSSISLLRNEEVNDVMRKYAILNMLNIIVKNDEVKKLFINLLSEDEAKHDNNLLMVLIKKDPLRHGGVPSAATNLFNQLDVDHIEPTVLNDEFSTLTPALCKTTEKYIHFVFSKLQALSNVLRKTFSPKDSSTQLDTDWEHNCVKTLKVICKLKISSAQLNFAFCAIHCWIATTDVETQLLEDVFYRRYLTQAVAALLHSSDVLNKCLAIELLRCVPDDVFTELNIRDIIQFFDVGEQPVLTRSAKHAQVLKENNSDTTRHTRQRSLLSTDNKKRKRAHTEDQSDADLIYQGLRDENIAIKHLYEQERRLRQSLEQMMSVQNTNHNLSKSLVIAMNNTDIEKERAIEIADEQALVIADKTAVIGKLSENLQLEIKSKNAIKDEHERVIEGIMKYIKK